MKCREAIYVNESTIDFPIFLLFFKTKFPIFPIFWIPSFLFSYFFEWPGRWTPWHWVSLAWRWVFVVKGARALLLLFRLEYKTSAICHNVNTQKVKIERRDGPHILACILILLHWGALPQVNFNHVNKTEVRYKVFRLNVKLSEFLLLRLPVHNSMCAFFIHCFYFICDNQFFACTRVKITWQWIPDISSIYKVHVVHNNTKIEGLHSRKITSLPNLRASFQSSPKIYRTLLSCHDSYPQFARSSLGTRGLQTRSHRPKKNLHF